MSVNEPMYVIKRNGSLQAVSFDKILKRLRQLCQDAQLQLDVTALTMKVIAQLKNKMSSFQIDEVAAEQCAVMSTQHPDFNTLAARIEISNHHKNTSSSFSQTMEQLYHFRDFHGEHKPLIDTAFWDLVKMYGSQFDAWIDYERDYLFDYFGFRTLCNSYLFKIHDRIVERPQHMWMRVAVGIHMADVGVGTTLLDSIRETYESLSLKQYTHATPTLFNAGTTNAQFSSCFLLAMEDDSLDGIFRTLHDCAMISKYSGGIGLHVHNVRAKGTHIHGTNGHSNGLVPMLRVFNNTARYVDQCFLRQTQVYTRSGWTGIDTCIPNVTEVLTKAGTFARVKQVMEYYQNPAVFELRTFCKKIQATFQHPLYVYDVLTKKYAYVEVQHIEPTYHQLVYPLYEPEYGEGLDASNWTDDDYLFLGIMFDSFLPSDDVVLMKIRKEETLQFVKTYLTEHLIQYKVVIKDNCDFPIVSFEFPTNTTKHNNWPFLHSWFFKKSDARFQEMSALKSLFCNMRRDDIKTIQRGWMLMNNFSDGEHIRIHIPNHAQLKDIFTWLNTRTGAYRITNLKHDWLLCTPLPEDPLAVFYHEPIVDKVFVPTTAPDYYYDLELEGPEHSYVVLGGGIAHNGGGKRKGSFAIYLEPWHADVEDFLEMKKNHGDEESKGRDLFYALWIPDLFMERVLNDQPWSLFCPHECPGLSDTYGEAFNALYVQYETSLRARKTLPARDLWYRIMNAQMETGTPFLLFKDACNRKSNQKNLGVIKSSNLCTEIIEYSDPNETAVCNLASIALPSCVDVANQTFDFEKLLRITRLVTRNLNKVIDLNYYPTTKAKTSNLRHRPIGIGVQGLADVFLMLDMPFQSANARTLNEQIFETMYYAALEESCALAAIHGPYETFAGSPASEGLLQFDLWNKQPCTNRYDWTTLKQKIQTHGLRNSQLIALMPTASTSQILGYTECFEPITSNLYTRRTLAGEYIVVNKYLMRELIALGFWNEDIKNNIIANKGSIQQLTMLPEHVREKYKIVWELPMRHIISMAADRGAYICQSQSMNLWVETPTYNLLTSMHVYSWKQGLKTGIYYLRRKGVHHAQQFTVEPETRVITEETTETPEPCLTCSA